MDLWAAIVEAMSSTGATNILTATGIYIATPLLVYIQIQFFKFDRREKKLPALGNWTVRGIAFICCVAMALFIGWRVGDWPFDQALDHAVNVGVMYPLAMWAYMAWIKERYPEAYRKLKAPRRRNGDDPTSWAGDI